MGLEYIRPKRMAHPKRHIVVSMVYLPRGPDGKRQEAKTLREGERTDAVTLFGLGQEALFHRLKRLVHGGPQLPASG